MWRCLELIIVFSADTGTMMRSGELSPERVVYIASILLLSFAGLGVIAITSYNKVSESHTQLALTRALWKFESATNKKTIYAEKCWSWRKLVLAGLMIAALVSTITIKIFPPHTTIAISATLYAIWLTGIFCYWHLLVDVAPQNKGSNKGSESTASEVRTSSEDSKVNEAWLSRRLNKEQHKDSRLPLTIVTGFLGSGKTTLVKNILENTVGMKVLVIENEIGEEGIDHELLMQQTAKEEIILMNNGCVCCTVRKDLLTTFHKMFSHEAFAQLDWIVIETTGMADPAPLIQSLYMDADCQARLRLDSVLTVVDCKHLPLHLKVPPTRAPPPNTDAGEPRTGLRALFNITSVPTASSNSDAANIPEAVLQITFADRILMNKTDLVSEAELQALFLTVQKINPNAQLIACQNSVVPMEDLLNIRAFDPLQNKALSPTAQDANNTDSGTDGAASAPVLIQTDAQGQILRRVMKFGTPKATKKGKESAAASKIRSKHKITTVSLLCHQALDLDKFNTWISKLLTERGADIYRVKGILWMSGHEEQFVAHGVHMIFDGQRGRRWEEVEAASSADASAGAGSGYSAGSFGTKSKSTGDEARDSTATNTSTSVNTASKLNKVGKQPAALRFNRLVFIGLGLDKAALEAEFLACVAN